MCKKNEEICYKIWKNIKNFLRKSSTLYRRRDLEKYAKASGKYEKICRKYEDI